MLLNIIPKELKNDRAKERHLVDANHIRVADWCRSRATALQHETMAEIVKKNLTSCSCAKVNAVKPTPDESESHVPPPPPDPHLAPDVPDSRMGPIPHCCSNTTTSEEIPGLMIPAVEEMSVSPMSAAGIHHQPGPTWLSDGAISASIVALAHTPAKIANHSIR